MNDTAPKGGAGSDDPTGRELFGRQDRPAGHLWTGCVRTGSSNANPYQFIATPTDSARSQRSRGLDSAERSPEGDPEARGSGNRERSERNDAARSRWLSRWLATISCTSGRVTPTVQASDGRRVNAGDSA